MDADAHAAEPSAELGALREIFRSPDLRRMMPGLALTALLANLLALAMPLAILQILDRVVLNQALETLALLAVGVLVALILEEGLRTLIALMTGWLGTRFEHRAGVDALERLMRVPLLRYQRDEPVAYAEKILSAGTIAEFYSGQALMVLFDLPFVLIFLAVIAFIGGWVVVVPVALLVVFLLLAAKIGQWMRDQVRQRHEFDDRRYNFLSEVLAGVHSIKTMMMESMMLRRYELLQAANAERGEGLTHGSTMASGMGALFGQVMIVGVVFAGAWGVIGGEMTPGALGACVMLSVRSLQPLRRGLAVWMRYQSFIAAQQRLDDLMGLPYEAAGDLPALPPVRKGLELDAVEVRYGGDEPLLRGLSLKVAAGECVAIRGGSGSGKSTLLSLFNGMARPDRGAVRVDGRSVAEFAEDSIHRQIAYLPQTGTMVDGTILDNLTMFKPELNHRALEVAERLGLDAIVAGMRLGYETVLGESGGMTLPVGVRQLITIVRALTRDPSVILFDEANIGLDMDGDRRLRDYLAELKGGRTLILVTPRPSMLALADRVYTLADGRLTEGGAEFSRQAATGTEEPLPERPPLAADLAGIVRKRFEEPSDLEACLLPLLERLEWRQEGRELADALPHIPPRAVVETGRKGVEIRWSREHKRTRQHLDLSGFCSVLANLGYQPRHFEGSLARLDQRLFPCLFLPAGGEAAKVMLEALPDGRLRAFDGGAAEEVVLEPSATEGDVYIFQPPDPHHDLMTEHTSWFGTLFWRFRRHLALVFGLTLFTTALALAPPLFVMAVYDRVLPSGDMVMAGYLMMGALIAIGLNFAMLRLKSRLMAYIGGRTEYTLGTSVFQRVLSLPASSSQGASVSRQVGRIKNLERLREAFLGPVAMLLFELPATLLMIVALVLINPWAVAVVAFAAVGFALFGAVVSGANERVVAKASRFASLRWELLNEALAGMRTIRFNGAGAHWVERFRELSARAGVAGYESHKVRTRVGGIAQTIGSATGATALFVSAMLAVKGELTGGAIIATMMIVWRITGPLQNLFTASNTLVHLRTNMRQIENLMRLKGEQEEGVRQSVRPGVQGAITLSRVSFRYTNDSDPALLGVSFAIKPRQVVVITGPDGAGKSTLLKLIERLFVPQAGSVRLDNVDIRQLPAGDLRGRISYMPQRCELFYGTIAQNLRFAHPSATDEELVWAAEMAGLLEEIRAMPAGFETRINGARSEILPHGFRQRLSLARTILKPASVVLLDEPGAGMDDAGEQALIRCIEWLRGRATLLMVSHRPGHMRLADSVIYLEHGAVTAAGPFEQVREKIMSGLG